MTVLLALFGILVFGMGLALGLFLGLLGTVYLIKGGKLAKTEKWYDK